MTNLQHELMLMLYIALNIRNISHSSYQQKQVILQQLRYYKQCFKRKYDILSIQQQIEMKKKIDLMKNHKDLNIIDQQNYLIVPINVDNEREIESNYEQTTIYTINDYLQRLK